ncbi:MAG: hypothetical protein ITG02_15500 [Patulibacter sp.]|nr:hypothetical protein [Patulibacter sp.]
MGLTVALALSIALLTLRWHQDWNVSEGTYALTSRALLEGGDLYGDLVVAHPPLMFVFGAGMLALSDSLDFLRVIVLLLQLGSLGLLSVVVWRLTRSGWATAVVAPLGVLLPWTVHEQGLFTAEPLALPLLAGAAVLGARPRGSAWAGALLAVAIGVKLPMLIPALVGLWCVADRRRATVAFGAVLVVVVGGTLAVFGVGVIEQSILAQTEVDRHSPKYIAEITVQAGWNLAPVLLGVLALVAARRRGWRSADEAQWRMAVGLAVGIALTYASVLKDGTSLTVLPPIEALLLPLAVVGGWLWVSGVVAPARRRAARVTAGLGLAFLLMQPLSLLADARHGGHLFLRPLSGSAWGVNLTRDETDSQVARLDQCPAHVASNLTTTVTFRAQHRMPGDQPDTFLPSRSSRLADVQRAVLADMPRCP